MQIVTEKFGNVLVAHAPDEVTEETTAAFRDALKQQIEAGHVKVVLQMDRCELYDSAGLTTLLDLQDDLKQRCGNLVVSGLGHPGTKIFELTRLDKRLDLFDSVIDAVSSFS